MTKAQIIEFVNRLTPAKREFLTLYLASEKENIQPSKTKNRLDSEDKVLCPHCNSASVVKNGSFDGKVRYKCKQCLKPFIIDTGWELAHTGKGDVFQESLMMIL
jgi:transposase-like protein